MADTTPVNVMVLGASGFIGRNVVHYLVSNDLCEHVTIVDKVGRVSKSGEPWICFFPARQWSAYVWSDVVVVAALFVAVGNRLTGDPAITHQVLPETAYLNEDHAASFASDKVDFRQANLANEGSIERAFNKEPVMSYTYVINCPSFT